MTVPVAQNKQLTEMQPLLFGRPSIDDTSCQQQLPTSTQTIGNFALNSVYRMDCIGAMRGMPSYSVDLAIADPPYNLSKGGNWCWDNSVSLPGLGGDWQKVMANWDDMPLGEYLTFTL